MRKYVIVPKSIILAFEKWAPYSLWYINTLCFSWVIKVKIALKSHSTYIFHNIQKQIKQNVILRYQWHTSKVGLRNTIRCALSKWHIFFDMSSYLIIALRLYLYIDALSCSIKLKFVPNLSIFLKVNRFWPYSSNYLYRFKNKRSHSVSVDKYF